MKRPDLLFMVLAVLQTCALACPPDCQCFLADQGRRKVLCDHGGLVGSLDVTGVDDNTEILEINAPDTNLNSLMIGPIFEKFLNIEEIYLVRSNIPEIGMNSFWKLRTLRVLNLRENNISTVLDHNFRGLPKLERLYLDDNRIARLSSGTFKYLDTLLVLSLARNRIDELVTRVFERLSKLQELILSDNYLEVLNPEVFVDIKNLKIFECRSCGLKFIDADIYQRIPDLTTLNLGDNLFEHLDQETFINLPELTSLRLDGNRITSIADDTFANQSQLKQLSLARNALTQVPLALFDNTTQLMDLDLSYNNLNTLDARTFQPFADTLHTFNISGNQDLAAAHFKYVVQGARKLVNLGLADMALGESELPASLFSFSSELRSLNMAGNRFEHFPVGLLSPVAHLSELDFSRNWLRGLDEKSLQRVESIGSVHFQMNKWSCDFCYVVPMLEHMRKHPSLYFIQQLKCHSPNYLKGRNIGNVRLLDLKKCVESGGYSNNSYFLEEGQLGVIAAGAGLLLLVLTIAALLAGVCYSKRHAANYYTHEEKRNMENDPMFDQTDILFDHSDISFKFPIDKKIAVSTINELKNDIPTKGA